MTSGSPNSRRPFAGQKHNPKLLAGVFGILGIVVLHEAAMSAMSDSVAMRNALVLFGLAGLSFLVMAVNIVKACEESKDHEEKVQSNGHEGRHDATPSQPKE